MRSGSNKINLFEGVALSKLCDYSFGDQASVRCGVYGAFMKEANLNNVEFIAKYEAVKKQRSYMTLFIDNIRLYKREIQAANPSDQDWINQLMTRNSLLDVCAQLQDINFVIFTNLEDTPIDSSIQNVIPQNVLSINAANALFFDHKAINPLPYGIQRKLSWRDNKHKVLQKFIYKKIEPTNLMYVNHSVHTNPKERGGINELFVNTPWARVESSLVDYKSFLTQIKKHKFIICPIGNAIDCHRNWETLYMRRVPIMKKNPYLEYLFKDFSVLFVNEYSEISENLLLKNDNLYKHALTMPLARLDLFKIFAKVMTKYY